MTIFARGFESASEQDWLTAVNAALKGRSFDRLRTKTHDGLTLEPLYAGRRDAIALAGRKLGQPWTVMARVEHPDPATANAMILADLENGACAIDLVMASSNHARGAGVALETLDDLERILEGVHTDLVSFRIDGGYQVRSGLTLFLAYAQKHGIDPRSLHLNGAIDPLGCLVTLGRLQGSIDAMMPRLWDMIHFVQGEGLGGTLCAADGRIWHAAGASDAQELGLTLATAVHYLRKIDEAACPGMVPQDRVEVVLAADADQFATIAKFRAMRRLWARVLDASGLEQRPLRIHAETAWRMMSRRDPWVNMLRTTVAAFAAGVGGADSVTVLPFTEALGIPDAFARRIARNTQTILIEECNLHRVSDPAAGSGSAEARSDALCEQAWTLFQKAEAQGGIVPAYRDGDVRARILETRKQREADVATRRDALTGTSIFPNLAETPVEVLTVEPPAIGTSSRHIELPLPGHGELTRALVQAALDGTTATDIALARDPLTAERASILQPHRLSEPYELLREASDAYLARRGDRPKVFFACFGCVVDFTGRATWAKNVFEAGGVEVITTGALNDAEAAEFAFRASGAGVACLCSSDALYGEHGPAYARALNRAGASAVYLAGRPVDEDAMLRQAGVDAFVYEGCDVLETLRAVHAALGLSAA